MSTEIGTRDGNGHAAAANRSRIMAAWFGFCAAKDNQRDVRAWVYTAIGVVDVNFSDSGG
jgi:hypothetical protein